MSLVQLLNLTNLEKGPLLRLLQQQVDILRDKLRSISPVTHPSRCKPDAPGVDEMTETLDNIEMLISNVLGANAEIAELSAVAIRRLVHGISTVCKKVGHFFYKLWVMIIDCDIESDTFMSKVSAPP